MKKHLLLLSLVILSIALSGKNEALVSDIETQSLESFALTYTLNAEGIIALTNESNSYNDIPFYIWQSYDFSNEIAAYSRFISPPAFSISSLPDPDKLSSRTLPQTSGANGFKSSDQVSVYPNPSNGKFTVTWPNGIQKITVFNMLGNKIFSLTNIKLEKANEIDLSKFQKGLYFIDIFDGNTIYSVKIVLQ